MSDREQSPTGETGAAGEIGETTAPAAVNVLNVKCVDQHNNEMFFKIKKTAKLGKLMMAFCDRHGRNLETTRFLLDDHIIRKDQTPEELEMEDEDQIQVFEPQIGGSL
jgi:hypothetical protein